MNMSWQGRILTRYGNHILRSPSTYLMQGLGWGYGLSQVTCVGLPGLPACWGRWIERHIFTVQCENCNPWVEEGLSLFLVREGEEGNYPTEMQKAGCSADGEVEGKA